MMKKGVYLSIMTAVISGLSIFANSIFVSRTDPLIFALIRNGIVAVILTFILISMGHLERLGSLSKRDWVKLLVIGAIGGGIPFALFFTGLARIGALNGNIIQKTLFLWVAVLAVPLLHERLSKLQIIGYATLFLGMFVIGGTFRVLPNAGTWLVLAATILWAVENVIAKVALTHMPPAIVSWGRMVFGLPFLIAAVVITGKSGLLVNATSYATMPLLVSSLLLSVYVTAWYSALSKAPATLVTSVLVFAPVVTAILSVFALGKSIAFPQVVNIFLLSVGTLLMVIERLFPKKQAAEV